MTLYEARQIERRALKAAQELIAAWMVPDSGIKTPDMINGVISATDNVELIEAQRLLDAKSGL